MIRLKKGDRIKTTQYPWQADHFLIEAIQEFNPNRMLYCKNLKTGKRVNLVEPFCGLVDKKIDWGKFSNLQILKLAKKGNRGAVKEYLKRFKKLPLNYKR